MHAPGCPALSTVALVARQSRARAVRHHHYRLPYRAARPSSNFTKTPGAAAPEPPSNPPNGANGGTNGSSSEGKPPGESLENNVDKEGPMAAAAIPETTTGGRSKRHEASASLKARLARKQDSAAHLPPVELPPFWQKRNTYGYFPGGQPMPPVPFMLAELEEKFTSRIYTKKDIVDGQVPEAAEFFGRVVNDMIPYMRMLIEGARSDLSRWKDSDDWAGRVVALLQLERVVRGNLRFLDAAWHFTDALAPAKEPEYIYSTRPFWWWDYRKALHDPRADLDTVHRSITLQNLHDMNFDISIAHSLSGLPFLTFHRLFKALGQSLRMKAPSSFDAKSGQRPINVLVTTGYGGKAIAEYMTANLSYLTYQNCVHVDAQDLSVIVGGYLGQSLAYSRGSLSTMGFRAAESNGKLVTDMPTPPKREEDDDSSEGTSVLNIRTSSLEDELQKVRQGNFDLFSKWDRLKIDNALKNIVNSADPAHRSPHGTVIHVHDYVELNMTIEGSYVLSRLRAIVDAEWARGRKLVILGTSSVTQPSDDFQSMVRELSNNDLVMVRHIEPVIGNAAISLEKTDTFVQNVTNIERMLWAMDPDLSKADRTPLYLDGDFIAYYGREDANGFLRERILPLPEIFDLASSILDDVRRGRTVSKTTDPFLHHRLSRPMQQGPEEESHHQKGPEIITSTEKKSSASRDSKLKNIEANLDAYEKRIAVGWVKRDKVQTTFGDVHAPKETVSTLKSLTSLTLTRPDAFRYGILAKNRITGCVLYGPPGTGKTMLAKAVANDTGANMLEISGASINDKWVGESEKLIRAVFTLAKKLSPCVVFIDEADAILASRSTMKRSNHRELINQFLKEWDGIQEMTAFIMVATNRPWDLDDAVLRRLPRKILVDLPLRDDRAAILKLLLKDEQLAEDVSIDDLADKTVWYSGSDLKAVCVTAAMSAVEEEKPLSSDGDGLPVYPKQRTLNRAHFERALNQIPASINEDMDSLKHIRKFDQEYGSNKKKPKKKGMGFGGAPKVEKTDAERIRPGA